MCGCRLQDEFRGTLSSERLTGIPGALICRCRRAYVIGMFASDTTVPTTKAAATAGMNQPGRTRARHTDEMANTAIPP